MPPTRRRRAVRDRNTSNMDPVVLRAMPVSDLRDLCRQNGILSTGQRGTLEGRLTSLGPVLSGDANSVEYSRDASSEQLDNQDNTGTQERPQLDSSTFNQAQMNEIKRIVKESITAASREIAGEAARAAVSAMQVQTTGPSNPNSNSAINANAIDVTDAIVRNVSPVDNTRSEIGHYAVPFQDPLPANYVKEIQTRVSGFELSKLLPKNLSKLEEESLVLTLDNSVVKVTKSKQPASTITEIEQWTTAFTTYMSVFIQKYPQRSQELLQYVSLIRYAARVHSGLGWAIYDFKFRQKAGLNKSLAWSNLDNQLWLTIFTVAPSVLKEEYPLFSKGPNTSVSAGAASRGTCNDFNFNRSCTRESCRFRHVCNKCRGPHPGCECPQRYREGDRYGDRDQRNRDGGKDQGGSKSSSYRRSK